MSFRSITSGPYNRLPGHESGVYADSDLAGFQDQRSSSPPIAAAYILPDEESPDAPFQEMSLGKSPRRRVHTFPLTLQSLSSVSSENPLTARRVIVRTYSQSTFVDNRNQIVDEPTSPTSPSHIVQDLSPKTPRQTRLRAAVVDAGNQILGSAEFRFDPTKAQGLHIGFTPEKAGDPESPLQPYFSVTIDSEKQQRAAKAKERHRRENSASSLMKDMSLTERMAFRWRMLTSRRMDDHKEET